MSQATHPVFALNHMATPALPVADLLALAARLGLDKVELRNDLDGLPLGDGSPPQAARALAERAGIRILTVNALQRFNDRIE